jgi:methyltransferase (TIGR00027 family)
MREDGPSFTARGVAVARSQLERPSTPTGDPAADERLTATLIDGFVDDARRRDDGVRFFRYMEVRTAFFDDAVLRAVQDGFPQIVILGAGYDGRALRFRAPGTRFFEVDHPATQRDKRARLAAVDANEQGITFVSADFTEPGLADALHAAGHDATTPSQFLCEGVLRYLPEEWFRALLQAAAERAAPGSRFAVSISTREAEATGAAWEAEEQRQRALADIGEPVLTVPSRATALRWLEDAGWTIENIGEVADAAPATRRGRLLVAATR